MTEEASILSGSVHGDEGSSEIDAASNVALLEVVLKANGEEHLYDTIMELAIYVEVYPLVIFGWQNVEDFVRGIQTARAQAVAPGGVPLPVDPLGLPAAVSVQNFREAVLDDATIQGAPARLGTTCLPCSLAQFGEVTFMLSDDPWIHRVIAVGVPHAVPIACGYVPRPRSNILDRATPHHPNSLWGRAVHSIGNLVLNSQCRFGHFILNCPRRKPAHSPSFAASVESQLSSVELGPEGC
ncbi:hypothetical protein PHYPSEUDO_005160 [Phytophthora pseudosyringae]|uniref:Uncharacterized protein n=1 Tax=Phytophthora pseudosyringae TaxID=221518 RepID=A0A8T1VLK1_9STRA|nr:hypothetical protein PHYPSEUDO_005160 [Phytophthora pseudosyringae]